MIIEGTSWITHTTGFLGVFTTRKTTTDNGASANQKSLDFSIASASVRQKIQYGGPDILIDLKFARAQKHI